MLHLHLMNTLSQFFPRIGNALYNSIAYVSDIHIYMHTYSTCLYVHEFACLHM